jgi:hypothetical protein
MLISNLTSSYRTFCLITKLLNLYLEKNNLPLIIFTDDDKKNSEELKTFFSIIDSLRHIIFRPNYTTPILEKISKMLLTTYCLGKRNDDAAKKIIEAKLGENTCQLTSNLDLSIDMKNCIDAKLTINNKILKVKIKPFKSVKEVDDLLYVYGSSSLRNYNSVDGYVFINTKTKKVKIFYSKNIRVFNNSYIIPKENELITIVGDAKLELLECNKYLS